MNWLWVLVLIILFAMLAGCATKQQPPIIETKVIDKPIPIFCAVAMPTECKDAYAVDKVSTKDDPVTINRAFREELEERWACEIKLRAAVKGCNQTKEIQQ